VREGHAFCVNLTQVGKAGKAFLREKCAGTFDAEVGLSNFAE
jgi:hypothetical protein